MIRLKVGHKTFCVLETNVRKSEYFNSYLERWNHEEEITLDEDPKIFGHVLNCLRYDNYEIPTKYKNNVRERLEYYGIPYADRAIWVTKTAVFKEVDIAFTFTGMLANIVFSDYNACGISIVLNDTPIFNDYTYSYFLKSQKGGAEPDYVFDNRFLKDVEKLEGEFHINITNSAEQSITIIYFERALGEA